LKGQEKRYAWVVYNDSEFSIISLPDYSVIPFRFDQGIKDIALSLSTDHIAVLSHDNTVYSSKIGT